jgi:hypothetical protein
MKFTRKEIWTHNSFLGTVAFSQKGLQRIINSKTATKQAKHTARKCLVELELLYKLLKERADD